MTKQDLNSWIMYHEIHRLHRLGFSKARIARFLVMDPRTVTRYLKMSEDDYEHFLQCSSRRQKALESYPSEQVPLAQQENFWDDV